MEYNSMMDMVDGHLGCFQVFTIANNAAMNIFVQALVLSPSMGREYSLME